MLAITPDQFCRTHTISNRRRVRVRAAIVEVSEEEDRPRMRRLTQWAKKRELVCEAMAAGINPTWWCNCCGEPAPFCRSDQPLDCIP